MPSNYTGEKGTVARVQKSIEKAFCRSRIAYGTKPSVYLEKLSVKRIS